MNITLSRKMAAFQTSIFNELGAYKKQKIKEGMEVIDLSVGSPDLPPPDYVMEELTKQASNPLEYGYAMTGSEELHEAISYYYKRQYQVDIQSEKEVLILKGSQDGLVHLPMILTNPGDIVLVPNPGYTAYEVGISMADATPYPMPLKAENQFLPDLEQIPEDICRQAKMMILNFPGNPVPALATREFYQKVVAFAKKYNIVVMHDFAYSELYYEEKPISFLSVEGAKDVGVEFNSFSKSFNMAGCRIAYVMGNSIIINALKQFQSNVDFGVFTPIQKAAISALRGTSEFSEHLRAVYKKRRDILINGLGELGWKIDVPKASMFIWAKIPASYTSKEFTYKLIDEAGIVVIPGNAFGSEGEGYVRIGLVQKEDVLVKAVSKLKESNLFSSISTI
ncbi:LL-diaminopimelate aminotransferase [Heyndrickxia camelliae]|uniref:Aminotransferase n=1 Tax=Heyndrickxia camelliae TaxID=1707093 RepID=A0A2N3LLV5_9BACI|nr:LL-diaminopimelate aminotransferase [Heyndrickxia camelliae]PKR85513.1 LL-diaminopimelate aminotransferase [Heyndrickxia camelliae]